jgi:hypothetical protein
VFCESALVKERICDYWSWHWLVRGADAGVHVPILAESPGPIKVDKHGRGPPLSAPIRRIFYLSAEGTMREHEVFPPPNPRLLQAVNTADAIVYGMGSLYTSICPSLILKACCTPSQSLTPALLKAGHVLPFFWRQTGAAIQPHKIWRLQNMLVQYASTPPSAPRARYRLAAAKAHVKGCKYTAALLAARHKMMEINRDIWAS